MPASHPFIKERKKVKFLSHVQLFSTPMDCSLPSSSVHGNIPGKSTGVGCHFLLQGIFPSQGSNPGLAHCRQMLYHLSHQGSQTQPKLPCLSLLFVPWGSPLLTYHPSHEGKDHHSHTTVKNLHSATRSLPSDSHLPIHWHFQVHPSVVASCPWTSNSTSVLLKTWSNTQRKPAYEMRSMVCMSALCF